MALKDRIFGSGLFVALLGTLFLTRGWVTFGLPLWVIFRLPFPIQDLLGHSSVKTTQRYCRISNLKVQRDYFNAMEVIRQQWVGNPDNPW